MNEITAGAIALELGIRSKVEEQLEKLRSAVRRPAQQLGSEIEEAVSDPVKDLGKTAEKAADDLRKALKDASDDIASSVLDDLKRQQEAARKTFEGTMDPAAQKLSDTINDMAESVRQKLESADLFGSQFEKLNEDTDKAMTRLDLLQKKWQEIAQADPFSGLLSGLLSSLDNAISKAEELREKLSDASAASPSMATSVIDNPAPSVSDYPAPPIPASPQAPPRMAPPTQPAPTPTPELVPESSVNKTEKAFERIRNSSLRASKDIGNRFSSAFGRISLSAQKALTPVQKLGNTLRRSFKSVFLVAGIYAAFRALKDGLFEALKANDEFNKSLNAVKANLSVAFTPIIQAVMPALNTLMAGLAAATKKIAGFVAGLFGKTYSQALAATKKLKGVTDAAKKASMATAGIDEMNILGGDDTGEDSEKGIDYDALDDSEPELPDWAERLKDSIRAGDWSGVGAILAERVNSAFAAINWEKIQSRVNNGVQKICDLINGFTDKLDWALLGKSLGEGINTVSGAINTFADGVKWTSIGTGIAKGLNKAIATVKWAQLGKALAAKIRILTDVLYGFVTEFNWSSLGKGVGEGVNGWFDSIDFARIGLTLSEGLKGIFDAARAFLDTVDFGAIGGKLADFINNIDIAGILSRLAGVLSSIVTSSLALATGLIQGINWSRLGAQIWDSVTGMLAAIDWGGIVSGVFELIGSVLGASVRLVASLLMKAWMAVAQAWNSVKNYFDSKIKECGGNVVAGIFDGILTALSTVGKWIKDHILKPFVDGFKKAFEIHSPSKVMAELGGYLIDGLFGAISDGIEAIRGIFGKMLSAIKSVFSGVDNWFREKFDSAWEKIRNVFTGVGSWFSDRWNDITGAFTAVGSWFSDKFRGAWESIKTAFSPTTIASFFGSVWSAITGVFSHVTDWFKDKFSRAWQAVKDVFSKGGEIFKGITTAIADTFKEVVNSLIDGINNVIAIPFSTINDALWTLRNWELWTPWGDFYPFEWLPEVDIPEIPHLAKGGLATAPTLAMVGDNRNAMQDPEVIAPLSKLEGMLGSTDPQIVELLRTIVELLRNGLSAEIIGSLFGDSDLRSAVLRIIAADSASKGGGTW